MIVLRSRVGESREVAKVNFNICYVCVCLYTFLKFASRLFKNASKSLFSILKGGDWFKSRNFRISRLCATV